jgi:hypothetical protein
MAVVTFSLLPSLRFALVEAMFVVRGAGSAGATQWRKRAAALESRHGACAVKVIEQPMGLERSMKCWANA